VAKPQRGDIFHLEIPIEQIKGSEEYGYRGWLIVSASQLAVRLPIVIAVPLTTPLDKDRDGYDVHRIRIKDAEKITDASERGCPGESLALTEQVRVLSTERLPERRSCRVHPSTIYRVETGLAFVLGMRITPLSPTSGGPLRPPILKLST
jgi:mRNA-degrading endonuclease toxin of MazEF toxin-antitoxin module